MKDYDANGAEGLERWAGQFDVANWGVFAARHGGQRVGGAVVAFDTAGVDMLEGRRDPAVLWDLRVAPEARGSGVGSALFRAAAIMTSPATDVAESTGARAPSRSAATSPS